MTTKLRAEAFNKRFQALYGNFSVELRSAGCFGRGLFSAKDLKRGDLVFEEPFCQSRGTMESARTRFGAKIETLEPRDAVVADMIGSIIDEKEGDPVKNWWENEYAKSSSLESDALFVYNNTFAEENTISDEDFSEIYYRILTNAVYDDADQTVIWWMGTSLLNHSCFPNVYTSMDRPHVYRAYVDIPQGSQLFRGYILPPDVEKLARINIACHWAQPELWEQCLCFKGGDMKRKESELVDIYLLHLLSSESGAMTLEDEKIWEALTLAYNQLQTINRDWDTKHGAQTKEWFFSWKSRLRKLAWKRWFWNMFSN